MSKLEQNQDKQLQPQKKQEVALNNISDLLPKCLLSGSEIEVATFEMELTINKVFEAKNINHLKRLEGGAQTLITAITFLVNRADKVTAVYDEMPEGLGVSLAVDLIEIMGYDTVEDIILMFKMARQGKLKLSNFAKKKSFYSSVLQDYVPAYLEEKSKAREKKIHAQQLEYKNGSSGNLKNLAKQDGFKKLLDDYTKIAPVRDPKQFIEPNMLNSEEVLREQIVILLAGKSEDKIKAYREHWAKQNQTARYLDLFDKELKKREKL